MGGSQGSYAPPEVADYGGLGDMTAGGYPVLGAAAAQDLTFSSPQPAPPGGGPHRELAPGQVAEGGSGPVGDPGVEQPRSGGDPGGDVGGEDAGGGSGGAGSGGAGGGSGGSGGSGGGSGGELPFTGLEAGAVAGAGGVLAAAGAALRRILRRRPESS